MSIAALQAEYAALCEQRDTINAKVAPLQEQLAAAIAAQQAAKAKADEIAARITAERGGESWLVLKRKIGAYAAALMQLKKV